MCSRTFIKRHVSMVYRHVSLVNSHVSMGYRNVCLGHKHFSLRYEYALLEPEFQIESLKQVLFSLIRIPSFESYSQHRWKTISILCGLAHVEHRMMQIWPSYWNASCIPSGSPCLYFVWYVYRVLNLSLIRWKDLPKTPLLKVLLEFVFRECQISLNASRNPPRQL